MFKIISLIIICISLCSCAGLNRFGHSQELLFKEIKIENYKDSSTAYYKLEFVGDGESCFDDNERHDAITVQAKDLELALSHFYKNKATWTIRKVMNNDIKQIEMIAFDEMKIKYEVIYCQIKLHGLFNFNHVTYASFRLINP